MTTKKYTQGIFFDGFDVKQVIGPSLRYDSLYCSLGSKLSFLMYQNARASGSQVILFDNLRVYIDAEASVYRHAEPPSSSL